MDTNEKTPKIKSKHKSVSSMGSRSEAFSSTTNSYWNTKRKSIIEKQINDENEKFENYRKKLQFKEKKHRKSLEDILARPGSTRWLQSGSGARLKESCYDFTNSISPIPQNLHSWDSINGYIGPSLTSPITRASSPGLFSDACDLNKGHCFKLTPYDSILTVDHAMTYLRLRDKGCSKQEAMHFSSKQRCRTDSTQTYDGPPGYRVMKRNNNLKEGPNWHGWQLHPPKFQSDLKYKQYKAKETYEDYEMLSSGYENFQKRFRIINGELVKQDNWEEKYCIDMKIKPNMPIRPISLEETPKIVEENLDQENIENYDEVLIEENKKTDNEEQQEEVVVNEIGPLSLERKPIRSMTEKFFGLKFFGNRNKVEDNIDTVEEKGSSKFYIRSMKPPQSPNHHSVLYENNKGKRDYKFSLGSPNNSQNSSLFSIRTSQRSQTTKTKFQNSARLFTKDEIESEKKKFALDRIQELQKTKSLSELIQIELAKKAKQMGAIINESLKKSQERKSQIEIETTESIQKQFQEKLQKLDLAENTRKKIMEEKEKLRMAKEEMYEKKLTKMKSLKAIKEEERQKTIRDEMQAKMVAFENNRKKLEAECERKIEEKRRDYDFSRMFSSVIRNLLRVPLGVVKEEDS
ncbi:unnamed protein product [Blepharisma stoltei]|uniref:Uncharacterized protein n=1 Tax=Blepharisma stoltei TaxID=1481888 RepID=A0AAU9J7Z3_9CILI|nr:unnamed protein product [Blepharisma stoltei]